MDTEMIAFKLQSLECPKHDKKAIVSIVNQEIIVSNTCCDTLLNFIKETYKDLQKNHSILQDPISH